MVIGLALYVIKAGYSRGKFEGRFEMFEEHVREGFAKVREEIKELKEIFKK